MGLNKAEGPTSPWGSTEGAPARILFAPSAPLRGLPGRSFDARRCTKAGLLGGTSLIALAALSLSFASPARAGCTGDVPPSNQDDRITCTDAGPNPYPVPDTLRNGEDTINLDSGIAEGGIQGISGGGQSDTFNLDGATVNGTLFGGESATEFVVARPAPQPNLTRHFQPACRDHQRSGLGRCSVGERGDDHINLNGAIIIGNVSGSQGADIITMTGGSVAGWIRGEGTTLSPGGGPSDDDMINISGGVVSGDVSGNVGNDRITWSGGFVGGVHGNVGDDLADFFNLTPANLAAGVLVDGGPGSEDRLIWHNTVGGVVARYVNWELFQLTDGSQLTFSSTLTMGDIGAGTGTLTIDETSTVLAGAGSHSIVPITPGQFVTVSNAGTIDLTNGGPNATDRLRIAGHYVGDDGADNVPDVPRLRRVAL